MYERKGRIGRREEKEKERREGGVRRRERGRRGEKEKEKRGGGGEKRM
ncbi:hypothetical protein [Stenotrophomonas sp. SPM]|nr:hypothetical protein [Stenotrophomonas sp. SPM]